MKLLPLLICGLFLAPTAFGVECKKEEAVIISKDSPPIEQHANRIAIYIRPGGISFSQDGAIQGLDILDNCNYLSNDFVDIVLDLDDDSQERRPMLTALMSELRERNIDFGLTITREGSPQIEE